MDLPRSSRQVGGGLVRRELGHDCIEETDELLLALTLHVTADDGPVGMFSAANRVVVPLRL
jgi:hypothetical protein